MIQFEYRYFTEKMKDLHEDNKQLKGRIHDMQNEKREQKKINSQLKKEIAEIKTLFKSSDIGTI